MTRLLLLALILALLLVGCTVPAQPMGAPLPEYVVLLTSAYPAGTARCAGVVVDADLGDVLTMDHCARYMARVVTQRGQVARVDALAHYPHLDLALLRARQPLDAPSALFAEPDIGQPALLFGVCPWWLINSPRQIAYFGTANVNHIDVQAWRVVGREPQVCPGDSGGPAVQQGRVIGVVHGTHAPVWWPAGMVAFLVPAGAIQEVVAVVAND